MEGGDIVPSTDLPAITPSIHPLPAALFSMRGKLPITLMDVSDSGATATGREQPPCDSFAFLVRNGIKVPATISWVEGRRFGLSFETPLIDAWQKATFLGVDRWKIRADTPITIGTTGIDRALCPA